MPHRAIRQAVIGFVCVADTRSERVLGRVRDFQSSTAAALNARAPWGHDALARGFWTASSGR